MSEIFNVLDESCVRTGRVTFLSDISIRWNCSDLIAQLSGGSESPWGRHHNWMARETRQEAADRSVPLKLEVALNPLSARREQQRRRKELSEDLTRLRSAPREKAKPILQVNVEVALGCDLVGSAGRCDIHRRSRDFDGYARP
jgi:hypothetical protein